MDQEDEPPPAYHELIPMIEDKPRSHNPNSKPEDEIQLLPIISPGAASSSVSSSVIQPTAPSPNQTNNPEIAIATLDQIMLDFPNVFRIHDDLTSPNHSRFYIRDCVPSVQSLLGKGKIDKSPTGFTHIRFQNVDGEVFLLISNVTRGKVKVIHRKQVIGNLSFRADAPNSVRITDSYERRKYSVKFMSPRDLVISRYENTSPRHICKIQIPDLRKYDASLVFSEHRSVTPVEKCLCLSVALVCMAAKQDVLTVHASRKSPYCSIALCIVCFLVAIAVLFLIVIHLNSKSGNKRRG